MPELKAKQELAKLIKRPPQVLYTKTEIMIAFHIGQLDGFERAEKIMKARP